MVYNMREAVMDGQDRELLERMAKAQERIADYADQQKQSKFSQAITTGATVATVLGIFSVVDIIINWIRG
jgi:hypothetical protein